MARTRSVDDIRRSAVEIPVPAYISLTPAEADYWDRIIKSRHADDWSQSDLELVADLCKSKALEKRVRDELDQGALMLAGKPHPLLAEAARCSGVCLKLVTALRLKSPAETRVLRGRASERSRFDEADTELDELVPRMRKETPNPLLPRLPSR